MAENKLTTMVDRKLVTKHVFSYPKIAISKPNMIDSDFHLYEVDRMNNNLGVVLNKQE